MQIKLNIQKKHFWIITSLIVMMIGALVFAADVVNSGANSASAFGHDGAGCNWNGYDRIIIKPTDFLTIGGGAFTIEDNGGRVHATDNRDLIANYVIPKGCKIPVNGVIVSLHENCNGATIFRNRITNTAAVNEGEGEMLSTAEKNKYYDITIGPDKEMKWAHDEKYISIKIRDSSETQTCNVQGGYITLIPE